MKPFSELPEKVDLEIVEGSEPEHNNLIIGKGKAQKKIEPITIAAQTEGQRTAVKDISLDIWYCRTIKLRKVFYRQHNVL